jgi:ribosomal protein L40E
VELNLPEGLDYIWNRAFADCAKLRKITLPASLETIGEAAFPAHTKIVKSEAKKTLASNVCASCGAAITPDDQFCSECGTKQN